MHFAFCRYAKDITSIVHPPRISLLKKEKVLDSGGCNTSLSSLYKLVSEDVREEVLFQ